MSMCLTTNQYEIEHWSRDVVINVSKDLRMEYLVLISERERKNESDFASMTLGCSLVVLVKSLSFSLQVEY